MKRVPEPDVEKKGRIERRAGQRAMQQRAAAVPMEMAAGRQDNEWELLARVVAAIEAGVEGLGVCGCRPALFLIASPNPKGQLPCPRHPHPLTKPLRSTPTSP